MSGPITHLVEVCAAELEQLRQDAARWRHARALAYLDHEPYDGSEYIVVEVPVTAPASDAHWPDLLDQLIDLARGGSAT